MKIIANIAAGLKPLMVAINNQIPVSDIQDQLIDLERDLDAKYLPTMKHMYEQFGRDSFRGKGVEELAHIQIKFKEVNNKWNRNFVTVNYFAMLSIKKQIGILQTNIDDLKSATLVRDALDYKTANLLKYINSIGTFLAYSSMLNTVVIDTYTKILNPEYDDTISNYYRKTQLTPAKVKYFAELCNAYLVNDKSLEKNIDKLPEFVLETDKEGNVTNMSIATSNFSSEYLDALGIGNLLAVFNPFNYVYAVRKGISDLRMMWLQCRRNEIDQLEKKIIRYKQIKEQGHSTKQLDTIIENMERDVQTKSVKLKEWEDEIMATELRV